MRDIIIYEILIPSLQRLYDVDYNNIRFGVSERNICARLAYHMECLMRRFDGFNQKGVFCGYYADVEYDKMNNGHPKCYEDIHHRPKRMITDLLIHSRGVPQNYLAVEMKRKKSYNKRREDRDRLKAMVTPMPENSTLRCVYDTLVGAFVIYSPQDVRIELYENEGGQGKKITEIWFDNIRFQEGRGELVIR